jgi:hypothetical protein
MSLTNADAARSASVALLLCLSGCLTEVNVFPESVNRVTDPESHLEAGLTVLHGKDGGAAAVIVELFNRSSDHDVILKVNTEMSAFIMLTVNDPKGALLSKPARKFNSSEVQRFDSVRIAPASSHRWRVPIAAQLDASAIPEQGMKGRLTVNIALFFGADGPGTSLLTLYDTNLAFTRASLSQ